MAVALTHRNRLATAGPSELRLHPHPQRTPRRRHEALRQRVQVVAIREVLQRHIEAGVFLQLVIEEQIEQRHFAVVQLWRGGAGLPGLVGGDGGPRGVGNPRA